MKWLIIILAFLFILPAQVEKSFSFTTATQLLEEAKDLKDKAGRLRRAASRCRERVLRGELKNCQVEVTWRNATVSIEEAERLAVELDNQAKQKCRQIEEQLQRDKEVIQRYQKTIEMGQEELRRWTERNESAARNALMSAFSFLVDGILAFAMESDAVINGLKGAIAKYEKQLRQQGREIDPFQYKKLEELGKRKLTLEFAAQSAKSVKDKKEKVEIAWHYFTANTKTADEEMSAIGQILNSFDEDPILFSILEKEGLMPLVNKLKTRKLFPKKPYLINTGEFLVDYGYNATEWIASRNRILQHYNLADKQLQAVDALGEQIKKTMEALKSCRSVTE